ncbi:MAG: 1-deoxy-D-xylulose-5-phosphate reductoisomerase [Lepagella sp.]
MTDNNICNIAVMGSTGSIGTQTLDVMAEHPECFRASLLAAHRNWELLADQARRFRPRAVVIADESLMPRLKEAIDGTGVKVYGGDRAIEELAADPAHDTVVAAMVGYSGLPSVLAAARAGKRIALANKETLVAAGELVTRLCREHGAELLPVDSEHSAIFQCLQGEAPEAVSRIILTASGGPFRTCTIDELETKTPADALRHPNWDMGAKVTIDSASMMNKGFEMIEARWLFSCPPEHIAVAVHPQSIVHSMVEFCDGALKAQLGVPDMRLPIAYALGYPHRLPTLRRPLTISDMATLTFEAPDLDRFPLLAYAYESIDRGGTAPAVMAAADEVAVAAFLKGAIGFMDIVRVVRRVLDRADFSLNPDYQTIIEADAQGRRFANETIQTL